MPTNPAGIVDAIASALMPGRKRTALHRSSGGRRSIGQGNAERLRQGPDGRGRRVRGVTAAARVDGGFCDLTRQICFADSCMEARACQ